MMATSKPVFTYNALQYPGGIYPGGGAVYGNYIKDYWAQVEAFEKAHPETKRAASDYYADPQAEVSGSVRPKTAEQQQIDDARSKYYDDLWKQYYKGLTPAQRAQYDSSHQARVDRLKKSSNRGALIALGAPLAAAGIGALAGAGGFGALGGGAEAAGGAGGFVFNPAVDSQLASAAGGFSGLGGASLPSGVNLGSLGGIMSTGLEGAGGFVFNPAVDSQLASAAGGFSGLGGASLPSGVNLGSLGGIMSTGLEGAGGFVFNPAVDSQLASAAGGFSGLGGASLPSGVNLGSLGGIMSTGLKGAGIPLGGVLNGIGNAQVPNVGKLLNLGTQSGGINWGKLLGGAAALAAIQALQNRNKMPGLPNFTQLAEQTANSQNAAVNAQTLANRPNQMNAYGDTSTWTIGPDGRPMQTTQFSTANQQMLDQSNKTMAALQNQIAKQSGQSLQAPAMGSAMANALRTVRVV